MRLRTWILIFVTALLFSVQPTFAKKVPVGMLFELKGKVEYSKNGKKWRKVRRNKFLYNNYLVRVDAGSSIKFVSQGTSEASILNESSEIKVTASGLEVISGSTSPAEASSSVMAGLSKKFRKTQKYTTVRRSAKKAVVGVQLGMGNITLSEQFPEIAWENPGHEFSYRVHVGDSVYPVSATEDKIVRLQISPFEKTAKYYIEVLNAEGKTVFVPMKKNKIKMAKLKWLSGKKLAKFERQAEEIRSFDGEGFLYAGLLKDNGLLVPALDTYTRFFAENFEDEDLNDLRPFLIEVYSRLKMKNFKAKEMAIYSAQ